MNSILISEVLQKFMVFFTGRGNKFISFINSKIIRKINIKVVNGFDQGAVIEEWCIRL